MKEAPDEHSAAVSAQRLILTALLQRVVAAEAQCAQACDSEIDPLFHPAFLFEPPVSSANFPQKEENMRPLPWLLLGFCLGLLSRAPTFAKVRPPPPKIRIFQALTTLAGGPFSAEEPKPIPKTCLPLQNTTFQLLGNMGYMSVKDELPQGLEF